MVPDAMTGGAGPRLRRLVERLLRIGELSSRVGVSPELLRAWERRYRVLNPTRSPGGFRLYSAGDEWRVRLMRQEIERGLSAAEAARLVRAADTAPAEPAPHRPPPEPGELRARLLAATAGFDEPAAQELLDATLAALGVEPALQLVLLPLLRELGERWASGEVSVAEERFASRLIEGRLLGLARGWNRGPGPVSVLACPPGEQHTLPVVAFGLALRNRGWRNIYLGADTPVPSLHDAAAQVEPDTVVLASPVSSCLAAITGASRPWPRESGCAWPVRGPCPWRAKGSRSSSTIRSPARFTCPCG
jgi:DNA-binding transcriptional MerR regulator